MFVFSSFCYFQKYIFFCFSDFRIVLILSQQVDVIEVEVPIEIQQWEGSTSPDSLSLSIKNMHTLFKFLCQLSSLCVY